MRFAGSLLLLAMASGSMHATHGQAASAAPSAVEMRRLVNQFAGTWSITEQLQDGQIIGGEERWRANANGMALIEEYHTKSTTGQDLYDVAMIWWDGAAKKYRGRWCADFVDEECTSFGVTWNASRVELRGVYTHGGKRVTWQERFEFDAPTSFTQTLRIGSPNQRPKLVSTILATRVKPSSD